MDNRYKRIDNKTVPVKDLAAKKENNLILLDKSLSFYVCRKVISKVVGINVLKIKSWTDAANRLGLHAIDKKGASLSVREFLLKNYPERLKAAIAKTKDVPAKGKKRRIKQKKKDFIQTDDFLSSFEWRRARYIALKASDGKCQLCGRSKHDDIILNVDHIKPRKTHPELALTQSNFQTLCHDCNHGKGNIDDTDWRKPPIPKALN